MQEEFYVKSLAKRLARVRLLELEQQHQASRASSAPGPLDNRLDGLCDEWIQIEANELGLVSLSKAKAMALALEALLVKHKETIKLSSVRDANGKPDILLAYPKLVKMSEYEIKHDGPNKAGAHAILGILVRATGIRFSDAIEHLTKAVEIQPRNWRIRSQLAATYMMSDKLPLSLKSLLVAIDLAPAGYDQFDLQTSKSKVLFNLGCFKEAKTSFEHLLTESLKYEENMTPKDKGRLTVCHYMLCHIYTIEHDMKNACRHWQQAETKRNSLDPEIIRKQDWSTRSFVETSMRALDPDLLAHQECRNCLTHVKDSKMCSACKASAYCSKGCQVAHWKAVHKRECRQVKVDTGRNTRKKGMQHAAKMEKTTTLTLPPLDAKLEPKKLWAAADKLARTKENDEEAIFLYLVALFMDYSLDAQDTQLAKRALANCDNENDPVAIALGIAINIDLSNPLKTCRKAKEDIAKILASSSSLIINVDERDTESFEQINRFQFGIAASFIFRGRVLGRCFEVTSLEEACAYMHVFVEIVKIFSEAKVFLDPSRWLTFQYELGYSNFDIMATDEAKRWLGLFLSGLESVKQKNGSINRHWTTMKSNAAQKCSMIPMFGNRNAK